MGHFSSTPYEEEESLVLDQVENKLKLLDKNFADIFTAAEQATKLNDLQEAFTDVNDFMSLFLGLKQDSKYFKFTRESILKLEPSERFKKHLKLSATLRAALAGWKAELVDEITVLESMRDKNDKIRKDLNLQDELLITGNIKTKVLAASSPKTSVKRGRFSFNPRLDISSAHH